MEADTAWNPFAYTYMSYLTPSMFAIGWFKKTKEFLLTWNHSWLVLSGSTSCLVQFPIYDAISQSNVPIQDYAGETGAAFKCWLYSG